MSKKSLASFFLISLLFNNLAFAATEKQVNEFSVAAQKSQHPRYFNERFVVQALVLIFGAQATYQATTGNGNYGSLSDLLQANLIESVLASGDKYGYTFAISVTEMTTTTPASFYVTATPQRYPKSGRRSFYIDQSGEMRGADKNGAVATVSDPAIDSCSMQGLSNEYCTIGDMRTLLGAQVTYQQTIGNGDFGTLQQLYAAGFIRQNLASGINHGYNFTCFIINQTPNSPAFFKITAVPVTYGVTGFRSFYVDVNGIIRGADKNGEPADENDPPINN